MKVYEALNIDLTKSELVCFVGGGGKTTAIMQLAGELKNCAKRVLVTTTTAIFYPQEGDYDKVIVGRLQNLGTFSGVKAGSITVLGRELSHENKLLGTDKEFIEALYHKKMFDYILVEGDGSKHRPIKVPASHEPVIPESTTKLVGTVGLDALGKSINDKYVHRPELFCEITGSAMGDIIDEDKLYKVIVSQAGLFKAAPGNSEKYLLLNKAENEQHRKSAATLLAAVKKNNIPLSGFIVAEMLKGRIYEK